MPVGDEQIANALGQALGQPVERIARKQFDWWSTFPVEAVTVTLADGSSLGLLLKELGHAVLDDSMRRAKTPLADEPLRELEVYRDVLAGAGLGTARLYAGQPSPDGESGWLLLEHVQGEPLATIGEPETWDEAARWLARFHRVCRDSETPRLHRFDAGTYRLWLTRAQELRGGAELEAIAARHEEVVGRLVRLPETLLHGEYYGSNIVVATGDHGPRICPVDWELAARGPALLDVASLTVGGWSESERERLAGVYFTESGLDPATALPDLECCRLQIALQWLGWAKDWQPPVEHRSDWLAEAVRAAQRIGIL
jgi:hypothetical protein